MFIKILLIFLAVFLGLALLGVLLNTVIPTRSRRRDGGELRWGLRQLRHDKKCLEEKQAVQDRFTKKEEK